MKNPDEPNNIFSKQLQKKITTYNVQDIPKIKRNVNLAPKVIIVDGQGGCGKTMLSPIIGSFKRVELLNYAFEMEWICRLNFFGSLNEEAATTMVKMLTDSKIYTNMMGRDVNFRYSDLSSVFQNHKPSRYFRRLFQSGDMVIPDIISKEKPILNLTTHDLLPVGKPVFDALKDRLVFIEMVRHPLFMLIQTTFNMERLINNRRDIGIYLEHEGNTIPYYGFANKDEFLKLLPIEQAIYCIKNQTELTEFFINQYKSIIEKNLIIVPFEKFVKTPDFYMNEIQAHIGEKLDRNTKNMMKKQNVPRKNVVDGIPLAIYKRCGWEPPDKKLNEKEEYLKRREFAVNQGASKKTLRILDELSESYENNFF